MIKRVLVVILLALTLPGTVAGSERKDIAPGDANWHRYRFHVVTIGEVAVRQHITMLWDNPSTGIVLALYDTDDPAKPSLIALSAGNDRFVSLDVGLLEGSYQLIIAALSASTHYHLNVTYGRNELLFAQPNGPLSSTFQLFTDRLIAEQLQPSLEKLARAMAK